MRSVRVRLALWNVGILALVLVLFGAAVAFLVQATVSASVDRQLNRAGEHLLRGLEGGEPQHSLRWFRPGRARTPRLADLEGHVLEPAGVTQLWDPEAFRTAAAGTPGFSSVMEADEPFRILSLPVRSGQQVTGVVQLAYPLTDLRRLIQELVRTLLALVPLALIMAGLGGLFLTNRALRPVALIEQVAREISAHDLSRRIDLAGSDEFTRLAATINDMVGRLENAFEMERRFVADASHELRTPLATVKGSTTLMLAEPRSVEEYQQALVVADRAADRMNRIVEDLLFLASSDSGQMDLELEPTPIADIMTYASDMMNGIEAPPIEIDIPNRSVMVRGDVEYLVRVFLNLLTNAAQHTPPSGRVVMSAVVEGDSVVARVVDTGEGIAPEHLKRLGERFYRVDKSRSRTHGGTGLGLAICRSILQAHGGSMEVESVLGHGTTVTVRLKAEGA